MLAVAAVGIIVRVFRTDSSAAHYRHCYTSPRNELVAATGDDGSGDADDLSSGNMIERGLRAHQEQAGRAAPPEPAARADSTAADVLDPGKYVANKQKDYILGEPLVTSDGG